MRRRTTLQLLGLAATAPALAQAPAALLHKPVPSTGERLPAVGLGTWITFNVGSDPLGRAESRAVVQAFFAAGGRLIDSSPMYGSSQAVVGEALRQLGMPAALYAADKVWTSGDGAAQAEASRRLWQVPRFDLLQVHNLLAWEQQLPLLQAMQREGRVRHVGVTTSEGRRHAEIERVLRTHRLDWVQLTYNPLDREAEQRLLPLAQERGVAVLANRPFREGALTRRLQGKPLPGWARELGSGSWAQAILKFIVSHPAITCAIPATTRVDHVRENLAAATGAMPDAALRARIAADVAAMA